MTKDQTRNGMAYSFSRPTRWAVKNYPDGNAPRKLAPCPHCDRPGIQKKGRKCRVCGI